MTSNAIAKPITMPSTALEAFEELPVAYVELNAEGVITLANRAARAMQSEDEEEIVGRRPWEFVPAAQAEQDRSAFFAMMERGEDPPLTRRTLFNGGEFRTYELHRTLIRDAGGRPVGVRAATIDVTETQIALDSANQARIWAENVFASMSEAIFIMDALGFILSVNPAAETLFGWKAEELIGKAIDQAFVPQSYASQSGIPLDFNRALQTRSRGVATFLDRENRVVRVRISTSPIIDQASGSISGVVGILYQLDDAA